MATANTDTVRQIYREFDDRCARTVYKYSSSRDYEACALIPSAGLRTRSPAFELLLEEARAFLSRSCILTLEVPFTEFLTGQISTRNKLSAPGSFCGQRDKGC